MTFILQYWKYLVIAIILATTFFYKTRYDNVSEQFAEYKSSVKVQADLQEAKNAFLKKQSEDTVKAVITEHKQALISAGLERKKVEEKLKGSINEISNQLSIYRDAVKLRNFTTNSINLLQVAENTSRPSEATGNCNETLATVVDACKVTDYDYETLYNVYQKQCDIKGCE
jgi:uncharacterized protein YxeA